MPNLHDIERRIKSVESTKQITHTMQMVAAAKIRHSTERVEAATPYGEAVKEMLANIARMGGTTAPLATAHDEVKKTLIWSSPPTVVWLAASIPACFVVPSRS